jgi:DNA-binding CsgD family transcriptional regulator
VKRIAHSRVVDDHSKHCSRFPTLTSASTLMAPARASGPIDKAFPLFARYSNHCRATALDTLGEARFGEHFEYGKTHPGQALSSPGTASAPTGRTEEDLPLLTPREREVAELIAKGYTNKAIAAELVLSPHTVGGHVERLFNKLGITARAQVAARLVQFQDHAALRAQTCLARHVRG